MITDLSGRRSPIDFLDVCSGSGASDSTRPSSHVRAIVEPVTAPVRIAIKDDGADARIEICSLEKSPVVLVQRGFSMIEAW